MYSGCPFVRACVRSEAFSDQLADDFYFNSTAWYVYSVYDVLDPFSCREKEL